MSGFINSRLPSQAVKCKENIRRIFAQIDYNRMHGQKTVSFTVTKHNYKVFGLEKFPVCPYLFMTKKSGDDYSIEEKNEEYKVRCIYHGTIKDIDKYLENYNSLWGKSKRRLWAFRGEFLITLFLGFVAVYISKYLFSVISLKLKRK